MSLPATELTTAATDALLAVECVAVAVLLRGAAARDPWRIGLWRWVLGLLALASALGAAAHGLELSLATVDALFRPLYLALGIVVALFVVGAVHDTHGRAAAARLVPWSVLAGALLFALTEAFDGAFLVFVAYEGVAMLLALALFTRQALAARAAGASTDGARAREAGARGPALLAAAILLNLVAAAVQASDLALERPLPLDHNGLFHLVQLVAIAVLGWGLAQPVTSRAA